MKEIVKLLSIVLFTQLLNAQELPFNPRFKPFYHGVASGDPLEDRVIIWTRITPDQDTIIHGVYIVASDSALQQAVQTGSFFTDAGKDYTVKIDVTGLQANTTYYYAFVALGKRSAIGRTKTTPSATENNLNTVLKFGVVSCSNYEGGYFNAYRALAQRNDLDAVIQLGDYIYEYATGEYRNANLNDSTRVNLPRNELLTLDDYRTRYSLYHLDPDLLRLHQQHPFIVSWDDHEFADNAFETGAENHQANEGDWETRKQVAKQAYFEWMPIRGEASQTKIYRTISYGQLMDLFMLDTRMDGREKQPASFDAPDDTLNPRKMISQTQYDWLINNLKNSPAKWKVIGNQVIFSNVNIGFAAENPTDYNSISMLENLSVDGWEGYLLQRNAIIDSIQKNNLNNIVFLSGDSHSSWAFDVTKEPVLYPLEQYANLPQPNPYVPNTKSGYNPETGEGSVCTEFCTPSLSAENFAEEIGSDSIASILEYIFNKPITAIPGEPNYNPHLKFVDLDQHGYMIFDVRLDSVQADFYYVPTVTDTLKNETWGGGVSSVQNSNRITTSSTSIPAPAKDADDIPAPDPVVITSVGETIEPVIFSIYPNPASSIIHLHYGLNQKSIVNISISNLSGQNIKSVFNNENQNSGLHQLHQIDVSNLTSGIYLLQIRTKDKMVSRKFIVR